MHLHYITLYVVLWASLVSSGHGHLDQSMENKSNCSTKFCTLDRQRTIPDYLIVRCSQWPESTIREEDLICALGRTDTNENSLYETRPSSVKEIHVVESDALTSFDFSVLNKFTELLVLNLTRNNISRFLNEKSVDNSTIRDMDLSHNNLLNLSQDFFLRHPDLKTVKMAENPWTCDIFEWFVDWIRAAEKKEFRVTDKHDVSCNQRGEPSGKNRMDLSVLIETCPSNCSCKLNFGKTMTVDCSHRGFLDFPEMIPNGTVNLYMNNNSISNFQRFIHTTSYSEVMLLQLTDNAITSLNELDAYVRLGKIVTLFVNGNRISHLPVHVMNRMTTCQSLRLGRNPWACDCTAGANLANFITDKYRIIQDVMEITCSSSGESHPDKVVNRLTQLDLCYVSKTQIHFLDVVNAFLAMFIVVLVTKLIYDGWYFRKTGKLPMGPKAYILYLRNRFKYRLDEEFDSERGSLNNELKV